LKTEASDISDAPRFFPVPFSAVLMCTVFDDSQVMFFGDGHDLIHIGKTTIQMYRNDGFSPRSDRFPDFFRIDAPGIFLHIHENRYGIYIDHRGSRGLPGKTGYDDFITPSDLQSFKSELKSDRPVDGADGVIHSGEFRKHSVEFGLFRTVI